jgi:hypothetical protein
MKIDIDRLTEPELIDLNHRVVERLRFLNQMRAHRAMLEFKIGDRVAFQSDGTPTVEGTLVRYNKKTVTVIADDGRRWSVSPGFLRNAATPDAKADVKNVTPRQSVIPGFIADE